MRRVQANKATPVLAGRTAQDRGTLVMTTVLVLSFQAVFVALWWDPSTAESGLVWLTLFWAALLADAWASVAALREAATGMPRPVNRWDLAAALLACASIAAVPFLVLRARTPAPVDFVARAAAMACLSALVLAWFVRRARRRGRLPDVLRGWPTNERGKPRIPKQLSDGIGAKVALAVFSLALAIPATFLRSSLHLLVPLAACIAAEAAAATRRATDTWWERPPVGFGKDDLLAFVVACIALPIGVVGLVLNLPITTESRWGVPLYAGFVVLASGTAIARGRRRWKLRHDPQDLLSIWD
jgi:hypothetical protein